MSPSSPALRTAVLPALVAVVLVTSGCSWFRKDHALYADSPENRPLEVPPDLDRPGTTGAMTLPDQSPMVTRSGMEASSGASAPAPGAAGFAVAADRDEVFERVGQVLAATPGASVAGSAQLLGTYDVVYEGSSFMIRIVSSPGSGSYVSAVDPRGQPAVGDAVQKLIAALRAGLDG